MAAAAYYSGLPIGNVQGEHHDSQYGYKPYDTVSTSSLKPLTMATHNNQGASWYDEHQELGQVDNELKHRIRSLKVIQRVLAALTSIATLIPITMTLHKYLSTRGIIRAAPDGHGGIIDRSAWALETKSWPTYMYFATALVSVLTHIGVLLGYMCSIRTANRIDSVGTTIQMLEMGSQVIIWIVATAIYKYEKQITENGKHNDLWGWTCSGPAQALQETFQDVVPFNSYCNIQSASWYAGLVQVGGTLLSITIFLLSWKRKKSKQTIRRSAKVRGLDGREDYRHQGM